MKKVLVTGAAGTVGLQVIRYLLIEGKYEITALDLKNTHSYKRLKKYRKRINIVYGDINDSFLIDSLIKDHDVVIHLASVLPPFADFKDDLCKVVEYDGTNNIINAINRYNPKCKLIYTSSCTVYGNRELKKMLKTNSKTVIDIEDYYTFNKKKIEELISNNIKNYTIYRLPAIMCDPEREYPMYNVPINSYVELISDRDVGYGIVAGLDIDKKLNKKTFNMSGGEKCRTLFRDYLIKILSTYGLSIRYILTFMLVDKNFYGGYYDDGDNLDELINFRKESLSSYYNMLEERFCGIKRFIPRLLAKPVIFILNKHR